MQQKINSLLEAVLSRQPVLKTIFENQGAKSLAQYAESWPVTLPIETLTLNCIADLARELYGGTIGVDVIEQLKNEPLVSTIDHHGILNHPFFLNSNLVFSLRKKQKYLLSLPTAGVSLNNSSWPGSLVFHDEAGKLRRISLFPTNYKHKTVFAAPAFTREDIDQGLSRAGLSLEHRGTISEIFNDEKIFSVENFSEQASYLSPKLWRLYFPDAPQLLYMPLEILTARVLVQNFKNENSLLSRLLCSESGWQLLEKYFKGLRGAFESEDSQKGSFLFWAVNSGGEREQLQRRGSQLISLSLISLQANAEQVSELLKNRKIYPGSLVCFLVLLLGGLTCLGGFNQTTWLIEIQKKFVALLNEMRETTIAESVSRLTTDNFAESDLAFLFHKEKIIKATGLDVLLGNDPSFYGKYEKLANFLSLADSIKLSLPEMYRVVVPEGERVKELLAVSTEEIAVELGLAEKLSRAGI